MSSLKKKSIYLTMTMLTICSSALAAPVLPKPGEDVAAVLPKKEVHVENQLATAETGKTAAEAKIQLKKIEIESKGLQLDKKALEENMADCLQQAVGMKELNDGLSRLTLYCRKHGYPAAAAYLPEQNIDAGVLKVDILPGRYGKVKLDNQSQLDLRVAEGLSHGLQAGAIIQSSQLETVLYNISGLGGIQAVGILSPGAAVGTSDLTIRVKDGKRSTTILYSENYGSRAAGRYRYGLQNISSNPSGQGDTLSVSGLFSNRDLRNYAISYEFLAGHSGTKGGFGFSHMNYELGGEFRSRGAQGKADTVTVFGSTPLYHMEERSLSLAYGYNYRSLKDEDFGRQGKKHTHSFYTSLNAAWHEGRAAWNGSFTLTTGTAVMDSDYAETLNRINHTSGRYTKGVLDFNYQQGFDAFWDMVWKFQGQRVSRNIDSSEEIFLGGANAVRAYPQGEGSGDEGYVSTLEFCYHTKKRGLVLSTYFDSGHVRTAKDGIGGGETMQGWGIGVTYSRPGDWFARFDYARRIGWDSKASAEARSKSRMWFILGKIW